MQIYLTYANIIGREREAYLDAGTKTMTKVWRLVVLFSLFSLFSGLILYVHALYNLCLFSPLYALLLLFVFALFSSLYLVCLSFSGLLEIVKMMVMLILISVFSACAFLLFSLSFFLRSPGFSFCSRHLLCFSFFVCVCPLSLGLFSYSFIFWFCDVRLRASFFLVRDLPLASPAGPLFRSFLNFLFWICQLSWVLSMILFFQFPPLFRVFCLGLALVPPFTHPFSGFL